MTKNKESILITGASSGIGKYATQTLAKRGWVVWAGYRNDNDKESLLKLHSNNIIPIQIDVTDIDLVVSAKKQIEEQGYLLKVLINNAGVALGGPQELLEEEKIKKVFEVNVFGLLRMTRIFLPLLRESSGRVINISSVSGLISTPFLMPYCASKYAVEAISDSLRREVSKQGIKVSIIEPGPIKTAIWKSSLHWSEDILRNKDENLDIYQPELNNFLSLVKKQDRDAMPLRKLKKPIIHAVESRRPKVRYLIYPNKLIFKILVRFTSGRVKDWLVRIGLK